MNNINNENNYFKKHNNSKEKINKKDSETAMRCRIVSQGDKEYCFHRLESSVDTSAPNQCTVTQPQQTVPAVAPAPMTPVLQYDQTPSSYIMPNYSIGGYPAGNMFQGIVTTNTSQEDAPVYGYIPSEQRWILLTQDVILPYGNPQLGVAAYVPDKRSIPYYVNPNAPSVEPPPEYLLVYERDTHSGEAIWIPVNALSPEIRKQGIDCYETNNCVPAKLKHIIYEFIYLNKCELEERLDKSPDSIPKIIALCIAHKLNFSVQTGSMIFMFDGTYWERKCTQSGTVEPFIRELCELFGHVISKFQCSRNSARAVQEELLQISKVFDLREQNKFWHYLIFENCVLDTLTMQVYPHSPKIMLTSKLRVIYDPSQNSHPVFDKIINDYTGNDPVLRNRLLEALALPLTNDGNAKAILCFPGVTNSAKSFLIDFIFSLLNETSRSGIEFKTLENDKFALSPMHNKRVVTCMDLSADAISPYVSSLLKQLSGRDVMPMEEKYKNVITLYFQGYIILGSNYEIRTSEPDGAFDARKIVIPFQFPISDTDKIKKSILLGELEKEKSAIMNTLLRAYIQLRANNYVFTGGNGMYHDYVPENGHIAKSKQQSIAGFVQTICEITGNPSDYLFTDELFERYQQFGINNNCCRFTNIGEFSKQFSENNPALSKMKKRKNSGDPSGQSCFTGIRWKTILV